MIRKDFIQRHFDELAKVLAAVLKLKNDFKTVEAEAKINDFAKDFLGIYFDEIIAIKANLLELLIKDKGFTIDHFKLLEELLYHKYLFNPADKNLKETTYAILSYVSKNDANYSFERMERINRLNT